MLRADARAMSRPCRWAIRLRVIPIPADTPDDVTMSPSSTLRAWRLHGTRSPCCTTQSQASLFEGGWPAVYESGASQQGRAGAYRRRDGRSLTRLSQVLEERL